MLVCINKSASENDDEDDENEDEIKETRVCRFVNGFNCIYLITAKSKEYIYNLQKYQALPHKHVYFVSFIHLEWISWTSSLSCL